MYRRMSNTTIRHVDCDRGLSYIYRMKQVSMLALSDATMVGLENSMSLSGGLYRINVNNTMLDHRRCAIHWAARDEFTSMFPQVQVTDDRRKYAGRGLGEGNDDDGRRGRRRGGGGEKQQRLRG